MFVDVQLPPEITEEMEEYLPEDIIYFDLITPEEIRIPVYLPKLGAGLTNSGLLIPEQTAALILTIPG